MDLRSRDLFLFPAEASRWGCAFQPFVASYCRAGKFQKQPDCKTVSTQRELREDWSRQSRPVTTRARVRVAWRDLTRVGQEFASILWSSRMICDGIEAAVDCDAARHYINKRGYWLRQASPRKAIVKH